MSSWRIKLAVDCVSRGGVIAYPTESVYGLGCLPFDIEAVTRILRLKRRHPKKGLIIVAATFEQLIPYIEISADVPLKDILNTWPGPITWVLPAKKHVPVWLRGIQGGIAVRLSAHPIVQDLCYTAGALVSTSANPEGYQPAKNPAKVRTYFGNRIDYILCGLTGGAAPTMIRHAISGRLLRAGPAQPVDTG